MQIRQYFLSEGGVRSEDLSGKEKFYLKVWERFKVLKMLPQDWATNGELIEEHLNALVEMHKLHNKKIEMETDLAQKRASSKGGKTVHRGF